MSIAKLGTVVVDCPDPAALAAFYAELLGGEVDASDEEWVDLKGLGVAVAFQRVPGHVPPQWPDPARPQQFHLDLMVDDLDTAQKQAIALGATLLEDHDGRSGFRVFADPAGHPFCLCID